MIPVKIKPPNHPSHKKYRVPSIMRQFCLPESKLIALLLFLAFELSSFFTDVAFLKET